MVRDPERFFWLPAGFEAVFPLGTGAIWDGVVNTSSERSYPVRKISHAVATRIADLYSAIGLNLTALAVFRK